jgi:hypothetical protein
MNTFDPEPAKGGKTTESQDEVVALEANRSFLEQFEEMAAEQGPGSEADEFLTKQIYQRPDRLSVLANMRGQADVPPAKTGS